MQVGAFVGILYLLFAPGESITSEWHMKKLTEVALAVEKQANAVYTCDATNTQNYFIYCSGELLRAVNIHGIYNDSKTFVDMPMKQDPVFTINQFNARFPNMTAEQIKREDLIAFLDEFFSPRGTELEECELSDWTPNPPQLMKIVDPVMRKYALDLNAIWRVLCRKAKPNLNWDRHSLIPVPHEFVVPGGRFLEFYYWDAYWIVKGLLACGMNTTTKAMINNLGSMAKPNLNWDRHSLIPVPHEFVVPGGRFLEFYYWDAYWIVKGLLACGMNTTTKAMINNLGSMVDRFGFVPNGGRVYYLQRSQPPFLSGMAYEYFERTRDFDFLYSILPTLAKEFNFWQANRTVTVAGLNNQTYTVYRYRTACNTPRPESYREDITTATEVPLEMRPQFYQDIGSAAESGWDFSTRWFADKKTLKTIETTSIAPIDLNALMCWNMDILEYLYKMAGNFEESRKYRNMREEFLYALQYVFYNTTIGAWFDYNIETRKHNVEFYPSIAVPLSGDCYQLLNMAKPQRIYNFMDKMGAFKYPGGVPTSLIENSHQQWDFPNGWSALNHMVIEGLRKSENPEMQEQKMGAFKYPGGVPTSLIENSHQQWDFPNGWSALNHMVIEGLRKSENPEMQEQAFKLAQKWVLGNYKVFNITGHMWEKYDVVGTVPQPGAGGEYAVQPGFGWSNGAILDLLVTYKDRIGLSTEAIPTENPVELTTSGKNAVVPLEIIILFPVFLSAIAYFGTI
ncbi:Trehalase [Toxocara canis]|uniref:Trehalase n=1 Tax=Toxocara canis TaxID=6265 RepID=A0A0B2W287_TOXCA|nr:Trehalase [Toxocara canis]